MNVLIAYVRACERASVRACELRACERASVRACERASVRACVIAAVYICTPTRLSEWQYNIFRILLTTGHTLRMTTLHGMDRYMEIY